MPVAYKTNQGFRLVAYWNVIEIGVAVYLDIIWKEWCLIDTDTYGMLHFWEALDFDSFFGGEFLEIP